MRWIRSSSDELSATADPSGASAPTIRTHVRTGARRRATGACVAVVVAAVALLASACIPQGTWKATAPAPVGITPAYASDFISVSCPTVSFCMAVGEAGDTPTAANDWTQPIVQTWDGAAWTDRSAAFQSLKGEDGADFDAVSCASATSCIAQWNTWGSGDINPRIAGWNGSTWTVAPMDLGWYTAISCVPGGTCLAMSDGQDRATWDGAAFHLSAADATPDLTALDCVSSTLCIGQTADAESATFDGATWTVTPMPPVPGDPAAFPQFGATSIDCSTSSWCVAVGGIASQATASAPATTVPASALWNGTTWSYPTVPAPANAVLTSVSCANGAECVAVGTTIDVTFPYSYSPVQAVWNAFGWTSIANPPGTGTVAASVSCPPNATVGCMGVGGVVRSLNSTLRAARFTWPHP